MRGVWLLAVTGAVAVSRPLAAEVRVGVVGGVSLAKVELTPTDSNVDFSNRVGAVAGALVEVGLGGPFSLRIQPAYVSKGGRLRLPADGFLFPDAVDAELRLSYVEVPLLLRVGARHGTLRPYALLGGSLASRTKAAVAANGQTADDGEIDELYERRDRALDFGAGLEIDTGRRGMLFLEVRYNLGLANVAKELEAGEKLSNRDLKLLAGLAFRLGG